MNNKDTSIQVGKVAWIVAQAIKDACVEVITHVPGFGANQIYNSICQISNKRHPISFNEEVGYTIAHGASMVGTRAATIFKSHGFIKASNSVVDSLYTDVSAGFVNIVIDDQEGTHSDCIIDIESYLQGIGIPYQKLETKSIYNDILDTFIRSEELALPYVLLLQATQVDQFSEFVQKVVVLEKKTFQSDITRFFLQPVFGKYQKAVFDSKCESQNWRQIPKPRAPLIPEGIPENWRKKMGLYRPLFDVFKNFRGEIVTGDTGISHLFAFPEYDCFDLSTYMGGSVPLAVGAYLAGFRNVWAITGDFSFIAAGRMGLLEALQRDIPLRVLIVLNGIAAATGGQIIPEIVWQQAISGYSQYIRYIHDPLDKSQIENALEEALRTDKLHIVVADYRN